MLHYRIRGAPLPSLGKEAAMKAILGIILQYFKKLDKKLFLVVVACGAFSVLLLYSIVQNGLVSYLTPRVYKTQLITLGTGALAALILSGIDYNKLAKLWFLYAPLALGLVILTFTALGTQREGSIAEDKAWVDLGFMTVQPSEFLKLAFIMTFAIHLAKVGKSMNRPLHLLLLCAHGAVPVLLVAAQKDYGTALVFFVIFLFMLICGGLSIKYIVAGLIALPAFAVFLWFFVLQGVHKSRILILFNPDMDPDISRQQTQGKIALGSGQLTGKGLFGGEYSYVSEVHNDFIFTFVGQALGFVGCMFLLGALVFICIKIIVNGHNAKDPLGKNICVGVFGMIFTHIVLNLGMVLGVMPVIGVPLPFVSAGGTAMLSMFLGIGLVMSTYSHSKRGYAVFYDAS